jgi:hypothetical protein
MSAKEILLEWVLPLLLYSGAVVPLSVELLFRKTSDERRRRSRRLLIILLCVQATAFLPFIIALIFRIPHAIHGLMWPALVGAILFLWGLFHLTSECVHRLRVRHDGPLAEPGAPPNGGPGTPTDQSKRHGGPPSVS